MTDWDEVKFFESAGNVADALKKTNGRRPSAECSRGIAVCMQQGRSFLESAKGAPLEIRPLLVYYGVVAFSKTVVLACNPRSLNALKPSHGLSDISSGNSKILNIVARVEASGTFQEFSSAVAALGRIKYFDREFMPQHAVKPFDDAANLVGTRVNLKDVLGRVSGLTSLYRKTFDEPPQLLTIWLEKAGIDGEYAQIRIDDPEVLEDRAHLQRIVQRLRQQFPFLEKWHLVQASRAWGNSILQFGSVVADHNSEFSVEVLKERDGRFRMDGYEDLPCRGFLEIIPPLGGGLKNQHPFAIAPINGVELSEYSAQFIGAFLLSSLVRYRPQTWQHGLSRSVHENVPADDRELALIERFIEIVQEQFPGLAVRAINGR